ncbi:MAG TPA: ATP-binding cassette domain-containing protein [Gemmatimonadales bacterium]|jgi:ABC-2 type transport system ATP-binding protein
MAAAVQLHDVRKVYDGPPPVTALDGVSLDVEAGTIYGLLGPNGAGKTTAIGICTTKVGATSGSAVVAGLDVARNSVAVRRHIGVAAQAITLDRSCTVAENLYYHCRYFRLHRDDARRRTKELLERFLIADKQASMPGQLSGGLAQRVQLARAIAHRPTVLFLDEPTAGLDPQSRLALWDLVAALRSEGLTVVLTTHYMEEADQLCQRVAIVDHGRILAEGTPEQLKQESGGFAVLDMALAGNHAVARAALDGVAGVSEVQDTEHGLRVLVSADGTAVPRVVSRVAEHGLTDLKVTEPSLETVFIRLTGRDLRE